MFEGRSPLFVNPNHYGFSILVSCIHGLSIMVFASQSVILFATPRLFCLPYSTLVYWHLCFPSQGIDVEEITNTSSKHPAMLIGLCSCLSVFLFVVKIRSKITNWASEPESVVPKNSFSLSFFRYNLERRIPENFRWRLCCVMIFIT